MLPIIILRSNLRLKFPIRRQHSWSLASTKAQDSKETQSLMCGFILNQLSHFNIRILNPAPQGNKKDFISSLLFKEAQRLLRTNSSKIMFEEKITNFESHLLQRGYPEDLINTILSEVNFKDRKLALQQKQKRNLRILLILPSVTQYQPSVLYLKQILMKKLAFNRTTTITERNLQTSAPHIVQKREALKDILMRAKL